LFGLLETTAGLIIINLGNYLMDQKNEAAKKKSGYVAILGKPNVGKSTLMNHFLGQKLSIVSSKPGTTRDKISGILTHEKGQIVFLDTPGLHTPKVALGEHMLQEAHSSLSEADVIILMTEASSGFSGLDRGFIQSLKELSQPVLMVINKADQVKKSRILPIMEEAIRWEFFKETIPVSCATHENLDTLLDLIFKYLPEGEPYHTGDEISDRSERFFIAEMIREKALQNLDEEVPHSVAVLVDEMTEREGKNLWYIRADIFVEKDSQKSILIGKKGAMLKRIGETSRPEIEKMLSKKVFLELWVKVLKNWRKDAKALKKLGIAME
jgi:GTP-binding protein Era